jgi:hypothetical protein
MDGEIDSEMPKLPLMTKFAELFNQRPSKESGTQSPVNIQSLVNQSRSPPRPILHFTSLNSELSVSQTSNVPLILALVPNTFSRLVNALTAHQDGLLIQMTRPAASMVNTSGKSNVREDTESIRSNSKTLNKT